MMVDPAQDISLLPKHNHSLCHGTEGTSEL